MATCVGCGQPAKFVLAWATSSGAELAMHFCDRHECIHRLLGASISASQDGPIRIAYTETKAVL